VLCLVICFVYDIFLCESLVIACHVSLPHYRVMTSEIFLDFFFLITSGVCDVIVYLYLKYWI